jgi:c-di-GMP-binding flagellar brake protein YcgR
MKNLHCPGCGTSFVRAACRTGAVERLLHRLHILPFRCQLCTTRFRAYWPASPNPTRIVDRREYTRLPSSFQAQFLADNAVRMDGRVTEISMGGCTFEASDALPHGSLLELMIKPASDEEPITIQTAMVCSARQESMGIRFLGFEPDSKHRLSQVVLNLLVGQSIRPNLTH